MGRLAGLQVREELSFAITQPIAHPEQYAAMGLGAATGVLLYGPPGCGKTLVAKAIANESGVNFISIKVCVTISDVQKRASCFTCRQFHRCKIGTAAFGLQSKQQQHPEFSQMCMADLTFPAYSFLVLPYLISCHMSCILR